MFKRPMPKPKAQRGISLVEVMVGMAIGLLASLVIFKSFSASEMFRRNVGGAADTMQSAAVVGARLNLMLEEGGAGLVQGRNIWSCLLRVSRAGSPLLPASSFPAPFENFPKSVRVLPIGIREGGTGSDTVMVIAGNSASSNRDIPFDSTGTSLTVSNPNGIGVKDAGQSTTDLLLAVAQDVPGGPADCQIVQVAADYSGGTPTQDISMGLRVMPAAAQVVSPASYTVIPLNQSSASYGALLSTSNSPSAFHLGREELPTFSLLSVNSSNELVEYDLLQRRPLQSFGENILLLKARYGVDSGVGGIPNDDVVDEWITPSETGWSIAELMDGNASTQQKVDQIKAIRIGLILRTPQPQAIDVRPTQLVLFQDLQTARQVTVKLSADQQRYGYQVFDWVIPLRNMKSTPK